VGGERRMEKRRDKKKGRFEKKSEWIRRRKRSGSSRDGFGAY
jgi:hypothetical protein